MASTACTIDRPLSKSRPTKVVESRCPSNNPTRSVPGSAVSPLFSSTMTATNGEPLSVRAEGPSIPTVSGPAVSCVGDHATTETANTAATSGVSLGMRLS